MLTGVVASVSTLVGLNVLSPRAIGNQSADAPEAHVAVCDIFGTVGELMDSDRYLPAREEEEQRLNAEIMQPRMEQLAELEEALRQTEEGSPEREQAQREYFQARQQAQQAQQRAAQQMDRFVATQFREAWELARSTAEAIAEDMGYDYVVASPEPDEQFSDVGMQALSNEVLSRTILAAPEDAIITQDVLDDLNLQ